MDALLQVLDLGPHLRNHLYTLASGCRSGGAVSRRRASHGNITSANGARCGGLEPLRCGGEVGCSGRSYESAGKSGRRSRQVRAGGAL